LALALVPGVTAAADDELPRAAEAAVPEVLTLEEAARFLRLTPRVVAELVRSASLPGRHVAGQWRFHRPALAEWLKGEGFANSGQPVRVSPPSTTAPLVTGGEQSFVAAPELRTIRAGGPAASSPSTPAQPQRAGVSAPDPIGEKPAARTAEDIALRDQGVLLPAGRTTVEVSLSYERAERQNFGILRVEQNTAAANLVVRYGLRDDLQVSARFPATHRRVSTNVDPALEDSVRTSDSYAGDLSAGLLGVVTREGAGRPNVILSGDVVLPTGPGDHGLGAGIILSKSFDPIVLFGGASYMRGFQLDDSSPGRVLAKHNIGFNFGYAYALNDSVALSGVFAGTYRTALRRKAASGLAPSRESYQLQLGATMQLGRGLFVEPAVSFGVGGSAPDLTLTLSIPYTF
jgi:excisionase family DNA binding protein